MATQQSKIILTAEDRTAAAFKSAQSSLKSLAAAVGGLYIAKQAADALIGLVSAAIDAGDSLAKTADRLGITTEALASMRHAGELAGVSADEMDKSLTKLNRSIAEGAAGQAKLEQAFGRLNLNARELATIPVDQAFNHISDAMKGVRNSAERTALAMDIFGKFGATMIGLMAGGSDGMKAAAAEALKLGLALSRVDAAKLEIANDSMYRIRSVFAGIGNTIATKLSPYIKAAADALIKLTTESDGFKEGITSGINAAIDAIGFLADAFYGLQVVWQILKTTWSEYNYFVLGGIAQLDEALVAVMNKMPGVHLEISKSLESLAMQAAMSVEESNAKLEEMLMAPMPSTRLKKWVEEVEASTAVLAEEIAAKGALMREHEQVQMDEDSARKVEKLRRDLEAVQLATMSEEEQLAVKYVRQYEILYAAERQKLITESEFNGRRMQLAKTYEENVTKLKETELKKRYGMQQVYSKFELAAVSSVLGQVSQLMQSKSKKQFEIGKKAAIAQTLINTYQAAMGAFTSLSSIPIVGPALGAIAAAAAIAYGLGQVSRIRSQSFDGGGGGAAPVYSANPSTGEPVGTPGDTGMSAASTIPSLATASPSTTPKSLNVTLIGSAFTAESMRDELIPLLEEAARDGVTNFNVNTLKA